MFNCVILISSNEREVTDMRKPDTTTTPTPRCFMYDLLETINQANKFADTDDIVAFSMFCRNDDIFLRSHPANIGNSRTYCIGRTARIEIARAIRYIKQDMMASCTEWAYEDFIDSLTDAAAQV